MVSDACVAVTAAETFAATANAETAAAASAASAARKPSAATPEGSCSMRKRRTATASPASKPTIEPFVAALTYAQSSGAIGNAARTSAGSCRSATLAPPSAEQSAHCASASETSAAPDSSAAAAAMCGMAAAVAVFAASASNTEAMPATVPAITRGVSAYRKLSSEPYVRTSVAYAGLKPTMTSLNARPAPNASRSQRAYDVATYDTDAGLSVVPFASWTAG